MEVRQKKHAKLVVILISREVCQKKTQHAKLVETKL